MLTNEHEEIDIPTAPTHIVETDLFLHEPSKADKIEVSSYRMIPTDGTMQEHSIEIPHRTS